MQPIFSFLIYIISFYSARTYIYSLLTMDDENASPNLFKILFTIMVRAIGEHSYDDRHYNASHKFNTSCTNEIQCESIKLFCNLTTLLCQCSEFYLWNNTVKVCEFQHEDMFKWLKKKRLNDSSYITEIVQETLESKYNIPLSIIIVMIIGAICFLCCIAYIFCYSTNEVDGDKKSLSEALFKQQEQSRTIQTSIIGDF